MYIAVGCVGTLIEKTSLREALVMPETSPLVISLVGAGGKTSTMYQLAKEFGAMGKRVIVTTSTHIYYPEQYQVILTDSCDKIAQLTWEGPVLVVGQPGPAGKLKGLPPDQIGGLAAYADVVLIEADGAKSMPLKVPGEHEPVLIQETNLVIGCAGLDSIGKPLEEVCFRSALAQELLKIENDHSVMPEDIAAILVHEKGTRKSVGTIPYRIILNKADNERARAYGLNVVRELEKKLDKQPSVPVLLTSYL